MRTLHFSIVIAAARAKVWDLMLDPQSYRQWTCAFAPASYYEGSWSQGSTIRFLIPSGSGMVARIAENRLHEALSIELLGNVVKGVDDTESADVKAWAPALETYRFLDHAEGTELQISAETADDFETYMLNAWPLALATLKALCEGRA